MPTVEREGIIVEVKGDKNLLEGENIVTVTLTNQEDKQIKTTYTIKVNRKAKPIVEVSARSNRFSNKTIFITMGAIIVIAIIIIGIAISKYRRRNKI